ncbi:hypothetical protein ABMA28_007237 [Loxostege sticticalis]|uniref:Uncharacterized protein n=1 Tax=Loxostege sticticalis TaxID=481309 RepID=A0ABD0TQ01_LOXSC
MAFTIALLVSLIAAANAGYVWVDENEHKNWSPRHCTETYYNYLQMPNMNFPPIPKPQLPRFPGFPQGFPFAGFPNIQFPKIPIPSAEEMAKKNPGPNEFYNGVMVSSKSGVTRDKDGNVVKTGGTSFLVNDNGKVIEKKFGNDPPNLNKPIYQHYQLLYNMPHMPEFKPFEMPIMPPILPMKPMEPFTIDPIEIENHVPDKDSHYQGVVVSSYSHSEDINGKKTCGGGSTKVVNVDGEVEKKEVHYGQGDKD